MPIGIIFTLGYIAAADRASTRLQRSSLVTKTHMMPLDMKANQNISAGIGLPG